MVVCDLYRHTRSLRRLGEQSILASALDAFGERRALLGLTV